MSVNTSPTSDRRGRPYIAVAVGDAWQRAQLAKYLTSFYKFVEYSSISNALAGCRARLPVLALVSEKLPTSGGYDLIRMLRLDPRLTTMPVVMVVARDDKPTRRAVVQCGANTQLIDTFSRSALLTVISNQMNSVVEQGWKTLPPLQRQALTDTLRLFNGISDIISEGKPILYQAVGDACKSLVEVVANDDFRGMLHGVRDHDNYSYAHSMRVATHLALFGFNLGLPKDEQILLASGGLLHDVGKMSIPFEVLNKPGRLDEAELAVMRGHVKASVDYLQLCPDLPKGIVTIAAQHHEKLDGTGYPLGLEGSKLNRLARMASIIDVFSALTDRRAYKSPMEPEVALKIMTDEMTSHLDMKLLGLFRQMLLDAAQQIPRRPGNGNAAG